MDLGVGDDDGVGEDDLGQAVEPGHRHPASQVPGSSLVRLGGLDDLLFRFPALASQKPWTRPT